jgi:hypothetical protein
MSTGAVNQIVQRAISDAAFRRQLQRDPQSALTGFDLTKDERAAIASGDPSRLTALGVDQRMSKAFNLSGVDSVSRVVTGDTATGSAALIDEGTSGASHGLVGDNTSGSAALVGDTTTGSAALIGDATSGSAALVGDATQGSAALITPDGNVLDAGLTAGDTSGAAAAIIGDPMAAGSAHDFMTPDGNALDAGFVSDPSGDTGALDAGTQVDGTQVDATPDMPTDHY